MKPLSSEFSPEVMAELARPVQLRGPDFAEIVGRESPAWHVVEVFASAQADVVEELVLRRFGVYVPEVDETVFKRGRKLDRRVPMFTGYVFVFMWYSDQNWQSITNTPGVIAVVGSLSDEEIDIVRVMENIERPLIIDLPTAAEPEIRTRSKSKKKRRWKKNKSAKGKAAKPKIITQADLRNEIITTRCWSAFHDVTELDSEGRNQTLRKALGLEI